MTTNFASTIARDDSTLAAFSSPSLPCVVFPFRRGTVTCNGATPWVASLGLGTPAQPMRFMLDTGTLNTWVTGAQCTTDACRVHRAFDAGQSSTYVGDGKPARKVDFGPWGSMTVLGGQDVCHLQLNTPQGLANLSLDDPISLEIAIDYDGPQFAALDCDGGLAIPSVADTESTALLALLKDQGHIQYAIASFYTDAATGSGQCLMGAADPALYDADTLQLLPLVPPSMAALNYLWCVGLEAFSCGGRVGGTNLCFALDTGSSFFKGSTALIQGIRASITDNGRLPEVLHDPARLADYDDITLAIGKRNYVLTPRDYFQELQPGLWVLGVQVLDGLPDDLLVVGSVFLDTVYTVFIQEGDRAVALASPIRKGEPAPMPESSRICGTWTNEFGSTLEIGPVAPDGSFRGLYRSHTGATGEYPVEGFTDPEPDGSGQTVVFSVSWRSRVGAYDSSWHWASGFAGLYSVVDGKEQIKTLYLLQQEATASTPDWMATAVFPSTFGRP